MTTPVYQDPILGRTGFSFRVETPSNTEYSLVLLAQEKSKTSTSHDPERRFSKVAYGSEAVHLTKNTLGPVRRLHEHNVMTIPLCIGKFYTHAADQISELTLWS